MASAQRKQRSRKHAKISRHKCGAGWTAPGAWTRPLRRLRRVIASSQRLIEDARRVAEGWEQSARRRPFRTWMDFDRASRGLRVANARLERALVPLFGQIGGPGAPTPRTLWATRSRWFAAFEELEQISGELAARNEQFCEFVLSGEIPTVWGDPPASERRLRIRVIPKPRTDFVRWFLVVRLASARDRISSVPVRRPRPAPIAIADAPRQISRGRAPPLLSSLL